MTVELLQTLSIVSFIAAGIFLLMGIALFFLLDVPKLYGDISGRSAKKAIEKIRRQNDETGAGGYKVSTVNAVRGKITDKITNSGRLNIVTSDLPVTVGTSKMPKSNETTVLDSSGAQRSGINGSAVETTVLVGNAAYSGANEPTAFAGNTASGAYAGANETTVLSGYASGQTAVRGIYQGGNETTLLTAEPMSARPVNVGVFTIDVELVYMGTTEIIR